MSGATARSDWYQKKALILSGATGTTASDGYASLITTARPAKKGDVFTFRVTDLTLSGYTYDSASNTITEASITVP